MELKAVFFDMGGTIQTYSTSQEMRINNVPLLRDCLSRGGIHFKFTDEQLADTISSGISSYHKWNRKSLIELSPLEVWMKFVLRDNPVSKEVLEPIAEELSYLYETQFYERKMRPEIPQVLDRIKEMGLKIGCISNTQSQCQVPDNLKEYGILEFFDPIVLSSVYGLRKPDASIFYHAARLASVPTGGCVYVGDKITRDIIGARRSGFRLAVQILHKFDDGDTDEGPAADAVIENMLELLPLLEKEREKDRVFQLAFHNRAIKAVFFDAGDILYYRPIKEQNLQRFLGNRVLQPSPALMQEKNKYREMAFQGQIDRYEYYEKVIRLYGITDPLEIAEGIAAFDLDDDTVEIYDGVPQTIQALKDQGFILGIITDTALPFTLKLNWFEKHGFGHVWDSIISSKDMGARKPAPILYEEAIQQTGVRPEEAVFVGHKAYELQGARAVGLHTIAFNYEKEAIADEYIENFCDLLKVSLLNKHN